MLIHLCIVYGCFYATMQSWVRDTKPLQSEIFICPFTEIFLNSYSKIKYTWDYWGHRNSRSHSLRTIVHYWSTANRKYKPSRKWLICASIDMFASIVFVFEMTMERIKNCLPMPRLSVCPVVITLLSNTEKDGYTALQSPLRPTQFATFSAILLICTCWLNIGWGVSIYF